MKDYGLVSIITPCYNSAKFISETIESIIQQTYSNWELIITDDCSTDNSVEIIRNYMNIDNRIKLSIMEHNNGAGICRNHSIKAARGRYIAFCDSDDSWFPDKLEKQLRLMHEKDCGLVYSSFMTMDETGHVNGIVVCMNSISYNSIKRDDGIGCLTAMYDTAKLGKMYMSHVRKRQDWGLWIEILNRTKIAYGVKEPLAYYRIREQSLSRNKIGLIKHNINIYRKILKYPVVVAYVYFFLVFVPSYIIKKLIIKINSL